jgi:hypothetical protein
MVLAPEKMELLPEPMTNATQIVDASYDRTKSGCLSCFVTAQR